MANYKFVDADQLDSDLSGIANAIRKKGGTSASMSFPNGFSSAINAISTGVTVKRYPASGLGTFTTDRNGTATVNCGFQPDVVYIQGERVYVGQAGQYLGYSTAIVFAEENRDANPTTYIAASDGVDIMMWSKTSTGFAVNGIHLDHSWGESLAASKKYSYAAIKYTA